METPKAKSILIIEDELALVEMYTKKFTNAGYKVFTATDGAAGVETALKEKPTAILIDLFIPQKDGMTVLGELRKQLPDSKLIIATNLDQPGKEAEAKSKGADGYIIKAKYLPSELVGVVEGLL
jgi:DNA-binding response OmpR family regulator